MSKRFLSNGNGTEGDKTTEPNTDQNHFLVETGVFTLDIMAPARGVKNPKIQEIKKKLYLCTRKPTPSTEGKSRSVCTMSRRENDGCEETNGCPAD